MASAVLIAVRGTPQNPCKLLFCPVNRRLLILVTTGSWERAILEQAQVLLLDIQTGEYS